MLHFTRYPADKSQFGVETHEAQDASGNVYAALKRGQGWLGRVYDPDWQLIHTVDWSDHRVHIDEMRKWLTRLSDTGELVAA